MNRYTYLGVAAVFMLLAGCAPAPEPVNTAVTAPEPVPRAPDRDADETAVNALLERFKAAHEQGNAQLLASTLADNVYWNPVSGGVFRGRDTVRERMHYLFAHNFKHANWWINHGGLQWLGNDAAITIVGMTVAPAEVQQQPLQRTYTVLTTLSRDAEGEWQIVGLAQGGPEPLPNYFRQTSEGNIGENG